MSSSEQFTAGDFCKMLGILALASTGIGLLIIPLLIWKDEHRPSDREALYWVTHHADRENWDETNDFRRKLELLSCRNKARAIELLWDGALMRDVLSKSNLESFDGKTSSKPLTWGIRC